MTNSTNSLKINNLSYKLFNRTRGRNSGSAVKRTDSNNSNDVHKNHFHNINNSGGNSSEMKNKIQISNFTSNTTLSINKQNDFSTTGIIFGNTTQNPNVQDEFEPRYIYIGFIMKSS